MAKFEKAINNVLKFEYRDCDDALHINPTEREYTFKGIYLANYRSHPLHDYVLQTVKSQGGSIRKASRVLCNDPIANGYVNDIYKREYWDKMKLDRVPQKVANDMLMFGVNAGTHRAVKLAQKIVNVKQDGIIGNITLSALNSRDPDLFDFEYDLEEARYYLNLIARHPTYNIYKKGWLRRAKYV